MVFGAFTVLATYLLGRELAGRAVGAWQPHCWLTSPQHILVNSHISWQHSTMPLYSTLAAYALLRSVRALSDEHPGTIRAAWARWLLAGGLRLRPDAPDPYRHGRPRPGIRRRLLLATLAVPTAAASWPSSPFPWPYLTVLLVPLAYSPVIIDNARSGWAATGGPRAATTPTPRTLASPPISTICAISPSS